MLWLIITICAYLVLAAVYLVDKYLLEKSIPDPKLYSFYIGLLGVSAVILGFFIDFYIPGIRFLLFSILTGVFFIFALFWFYRTLQLFEASRVVPAVGGLTPLFSLALVYFLSRGGIVLNVWKTLALFILIGGSILISYKPDKRGLKNTFKTVLFCSIAAFLMALFFVMSKYVYNASPSFLFGFIWMRVGGGIAALIFLIVSEQVRGEFLKWFRLSRSVSDKKKSNSQKTAVVFITNQIFGATGSVLQNLAVFLAPTVAYVSLINALQGTQYLFLFVFIWVLSLKLPNIIKEDISKKAIIQKLLAILLIGTGVSILAILK